MTARARALPRYSVGELFCGAGGLSRGFHDLGFQPKFANDAWDVALHTFRMNFDSVYASTGGKKYGAVLPLPGSVEHLSPSDILRRIPARNGTAPMAVGDLDVLLGGPPCQGYSLNSHIRSGEDPRNHLFRHYVRLLHGLAPKVFVLENVPGMFSLEGGSFFQELIEAISAPRAREHIGYEVDYKILNAAHYGVPQERFRIVVVGTRRDIANRARKAHLPEPVHYSLARAHFKGGRTHTFHFAIGHRGAACERMVSLLETGLLAPVTVSEAIGDLPPLNNGGGEDTSSYARTKPASYYQKQMRGTSRVLTNHWCRALLPPNTERVKHIPPGGDWRSIPTRLLPPGMQKALRKDHTTRYGRLARDGLAGTLLTKPDPHWGTFLHYDVNQQRLISVREAARFQSFTDEHVFYGGQVDQYKLCGNAVPPLMARAIAVRIQQVLDSYYGRSRARQRDADALAVA